MTNSHRAHTKTGRTVALGALATLALLGAGAASMNQAFADNPDQDTTKTGTKAGAKQGTDNGSHPLTLSGDTAPATPRSATAALQAAVAEVSDGTASGFAGFLPAGATSGMLTLTPADGSPAADVDVDLWNHTFTDAEVAAEFDCDMTFKQDCQVTTLDDGSQLTTYTLDLTSAPDGGAVVTRYAVRLAGDTLVKISASNVEDATGDGHLTRDDAVLTADQLAEIASEPWWGSDLPVEFARAGAKLTPFVTPFKNGAKVLPAA